MSEQKKPRLNGRLDIRLEESILKERGNQALKILESPIFPFDKTVDEMSPQELLEFCHMCKVWQDRAKEFLAMANGKIIEGLREDYAEEAKRKKYENPDREKQARKLAKGLDKESAKLVRMVILNKWDIPDYLSMSKVELKKAIAKYLAS